MAGMMEERHFSRENLQARANYLMESISKKLQENKINEKLIKSLEKETEKFNVHIRFRKSFLQILIKDCNPKKSINFQRHRLNKLLKNNIVNMKFRQEIANFIKNSTRININVASDLIQYLRLKCEESHKEIKLNKNFVKFFLNDIITNRLHIDQEVEELTRISKAL